KRCGFPRPVDSAPVSPKGPRKACKRQWLRPLPLTRRPRGRAIAAVRAVRHRPPPVRGRVVSPDLGPLRPVLMPGPRLEKAELLVGHLIHFAEKLDHHAVGTLVIDGDVVADNVAQRAPGQLDLVLGEEIAGSLDVGPVAYLKCNMMNRGLGVAQEIHGVMIAAATQEGEEIASPIRDAETEH